MKKTVWLTLFIALAAVNLAAWLVERYTGFYIVMMFRLALVFGITAIASIFVGAMMLVKTMEQEKPLSDPARQSSQGNKKQSENPE
ncbi:MAG: hypothetical protein WD772_03670 [Pseudohongiellaceae bacterium]